MKWDARYKNVDRVGTIYNLKNSFFKELGDFTSLKTNKKSWKKAVFT